MLPDARGGGSDGSQPRRIQEAAARREWSPRTTLAHKRGLVFGTCTNAKPGVRIHARYEGVAEMTMKRVETVTEQPTLPPLDVASLPADLPAALKFGPLGESDLQPVASLRGTSEPWAKRGETPEESLQAISQLRPFIHVARLQGQIRSEERR